MTSTSPKIAVYWDFENLHASLYEQSTNEPYSPYHIQRERMLNVSSLMDYLYSLGDVVINRAYNDWQWYRVYKNELLFHAIDLIQLYPKGAHAKNGADIRLAMDALEDAYQHSYISHVVIIGGDSDYIAVAQKLKKLGKFVIGIGVQATTNPFWTRSCNEFKYYETLMRVSPQEPEHTEPSAPAASPVPSPLPDLAAARELLVRAVQRLMAEDDVEAVLKAKVRPMMTRLDPGFDPANYHFQTFNGFLSACNDIIYSFKGENDMMIALKPGGHQQAAVAQPPSDATGAGTNTPIIAQLPPTFNPALEYFLWCVHVNCFNGTTSVTLSDIGVTLKLFDPSFTISDHGYPKKNGLKCLADHAASLGLVQTTYNADSNVHAVSLTDVFLQAISSLAVPVNLQTVRCARAMNKLFLLVRTDELTGVLNDTRLVLEQLRAQGEGISLTKLSNTIVDKCDGGGMKKRTKYIMQHLTHLGCFTDDTGHQVSPINDQPVTNLALPHNMGEMYIEFVGKQLYAFTGETFPRILIESCINALPPFARPSLLV